MTNRARNIAVMVGTMCTVALIVTAVLAQESVKTSAVLESAVASTPPLKLAIPSRAELEKQFEEELTGSTLTGVWQMTGEGGLSGQAALTAPKPDHYAIAKVSKVSDDYWVITARIQYAEKDAHFPFRFA